MSSQSALGDWQNADAVQQAVRADACEESGQTPQWAPGGAEGERADAQCCQHCGAQVTQQFRRVFGDNDDLVFACHRCLTGAGLLRGAAAEPEAAEAAREAQP